MPGEGSALTGGPSFVLSWPSLHKIRPLTDLGSRSICLIEVETPRKHGSGHKPK